MARKKKEEASLSDVAKDLATNMNKMFKNSGFDMSVGLDDDNSAEVTHWIPTGCRPLDLAISNLSDRGGFPCGRISILWGPEQSGKSLFAMHAIANTQKAGGIAFYVDAEHSLHRAFATAIGVDLDTLQYTEEQRCELVFKLIEEVSIRYRAAFPDKLICIVVDSLAALITEDNLERGHDQKGYDTSLSKALASSLKLLGGIIRKTNVALICTNQARQKMDRANIYESKWKQYGGQSAPHWSSLSIFMEQSKAITIGTSPNKREIGRVVRAKTVKNRLAPPNVKMTFNIYYDRGVDDFRSWEDLAKKFSECKYDGAYVSYKSSDGRDFKEKGWSNFCKNVLEKDAGVADEVWYGLTNNYIIDYHDENRVETIEGDPSTELPPDGSE